MPPRESIAWVERKRSLRARYLDAERVIPQNKTIALSGGLGRLSRLVGTMPEPAGESINSPDSMPGSEASIAPWNCSDTLIRLPGELAV